MVNNVKDLRGGKGGFCYEGPGVKRMSAKHPGFDTPKPAKMSTQHTLTGQKISGKHNMDQGGSNRIGKDCKGFGHSNYRLAGPKSNYPKHAGQPSGHKDKA